MNLIRRTIATVVIFLGVLTTGAEAQSPLARIGRVSDHANVLDDHAERQLETQLAHLTTTTGVLVLVVTVPTLSELSPDEYARSLVRSWQLPRENPAWILILVAPNTEQLRIRVGEPLFQSAFRQSAIDHLVATLRPHFHEGSYAAGLLAGIAEIEAALPIPEVEASPAATMAPINWKLVLIVVLVILAILFIVWLVRSSDRSGYRSGGDYYSGDSGWWSISIGGDGGGGGGFGDGGGGGD